MTEQNTFSQFEQLAEQMGISFVEGKGDFAGGFCTLNGDRFIVLNRLKPMSQRLRVLARSFHELRLDQRYVIPSLREFISEQIYKESVASTPSEIT
jgi:hypothetical protein